MNKTEQQKKNKIFDILIIVNILLILISGFYLRFYKLAEVYTEYDDVGVVSLHKSLSNAHKKISLLNNSVLDIKINVKSKGLKENLLDSIWYVPYIGFAWTYPIGQYMIHPLLIDEGDSYYKKLWCSRMVSSLVSCLSLLLFLYLLYFMNGRRLDEMVLIPLALLNFSFNGILYAHHASPYSMTVLTLLISIILFTRYFEKRLSITFFFIFNAILIIFNYLILLLMPAYFVVIVVNERIKSVKKIIQKFYRGILSFIFIVAPVFIIFLKVSKGMRGINPPKEFSVSYLLYFPKQFILSVSSTITGFFINDVVTVCLVSLCFILVCWGYFRKQFLKNDLDSLMVLIIGILSLEWIILHGMSKLIMDTTRHMLMWGPLIAIIFIIILKKSKRYPVFPVFIVILVLILGFLSFQKNIDIIDSKRNQFQFDLLAKNKINTLITYSFTLSPMIYFSEREVYNLDVGSFNKETFGDKIPKKMLLVSQCAKIDDYLKQKSIRPFIRNFLSRYSIVPILLEFIKEKKKYVEKAYRI